jgi:hypothetical protein
MEDIKFNAMAGLWKTPKEAFCRCFQQWQDQASLCLCVCVQRSYFKRDYVSTAVCPTITVQHLTF